MRPACCGDVKIELVYQYNTEDVQYESTIVHFQKFQYSITLNRRSMKIIVLIALMISPIQLGSAHTVEGCGVYTQPRTWSVSRPRSY